MYFDLNIFSIYIMEDLVSFPNTIETKMYPYRKSIITNLIPHKT